MPPRCEKCGFLHYRTDPCRVKKESTAARKDVPSLDPQVPEEHALTAGRVRAKRGKAHYKGESPVGEMSGTIEASKQHVAENLAGTQALPVDTTIPKPKRSGNRHRSGYFTEYMRKYRADKKAGIR